MNFTELTNSIVAVHHSFLRRELPAVSTQLEELSKELGNSTEISEAQSLFKKIRDKVEAHIKDEETTLFPTGSALEQGQTPPQAEFDLLERLASMEKEHDNCGNALKLLHQMLSDLPPSELQERVAMSVSALSQDMDEHVRKENTEVHPRFLELLKTATNTRK
ncbi:MAG: hemerythrin domain-containing protein [Candidatus Obscuribacterales bacterium]|nr:hemerythrin domain-containing protein [Candidatus Obscuribacterales bacterium]